MFTTPLIAVADAQAPPAAVLRGLVRALADSDASVRRAAANTLILVEPDPILVLPAWINILQTEDAGIRRTAIEEIGKYGPVAREAVPVLVAKLRSTPSARERSEIVSALAGIGDVSAPHFQSILDDPSASRYLKDNARVGLTTLSQRRKTPAWKTHPTPADWPEIRAALNADFIGDRRDALRALAQLHPEVPDVIPTVISFVKDGPVGLHYAAAEALANIGPDAHAAIPSLIELSYTGELYARMYACRALGEIHSAPVLSLPALASALDDPDMEVRTAAVRALADFPARDLTDVLLPLGYEASLLNALDTVRSVVREGFEEPHSRATTLRVLELASHESRAIRAWVVQMPYFLVESLHIASQEDRGATVQPYVPASTIIDGALPLFFDPDADVRYEMLSWVAKEVLPCVPQGLPLLRLLLHDSDDLVRETVLEALGTFGAAGEPAVPELIGLLDHEDVRTRGAALAALYGIGPWASDAVEPLLQILREGRDMDPGGGWISLGSGYVVGLVLGEIGAPKLDVLRAALHEDDVVTGAVLLALIRMGPDAAPAVPDLVRLIESRDAQVRVYAATALGAIHSNPQQVLPNLSRRLQEEVESNAASAAVQAIAQFGMQAVPTVRPLLHDDRPMVRRLAARTVKAIGPNAVALVPDLLPLLDDADPSVQALALSALEAVRVEPDVVLPRVAAKFESEHAHVRHAAARAVAGYGGTGLTALGRLLRHEKPSVRAAALFALAEIGAEARSETAAILSLLDSDPSPEVRAQAATTLGRLYGRVYAQQ